MGVLNVTPDSFADTDPVITPTGVPDVSRAVLRARTMEAAGADLIDIGGESTRPGAVPLSVDEELSRVLPVIEAVADAIRVPISVDTYKSSVAAHSIAAGATLVNDVSGLQYDPELGRVVEETGAALILMHTRGRSASMYDEARYDDLVTEVTSELEASIARAVESGVPRDRLIVDPGIGFAKRAEHSYGVLARFPEMAAVLGRPVLIGPSRKSFLQAGAGNAPPAARDWATAGAVAAAVLAGAHIIRVHAVPEQLQVVRVAEAIRQSGVRHA
ncbi:MAG: dihydropteroate synthase [Vicinamibacterales bacterium]